MPSKEQWKEKFKDASPEQTVSRIEYLLKEAGLHFEHSFLPQTDIENCVSSRITLTDKLTVIGTNGKGTTHAFCAASAHAEFMERLQNRVFMLGISHDDPFAKELLEWAQGSDYLVADYSELLDNECFLRLRERLVRSSKTSKNPVIFPEQLVDTLLRKLIPIEADGKVLLSPCYNPEKGVYESIPLEFCRFFVLSNGMAAGNTLPEAIVQAYCEIFERYAQNKVIDDHITPPEIPLEYIKGNYPNIAQIINQIEHKGSYRVIVKDCSLNMRLPVVCGMVIDISTGRYGFKLGSHPSMEVALERVFTESLQGRNLEQLTNGASLVFQEDAAVNRFNSWNIAKMGIGNIPNSFFAEKSSYPFISWPDVSSLGNKELVYKYTRLLKEIGGTVYIEDVSFMGFPSVCIYAQGISEIVPVDIFQLKENVFRNEVQSIMRKLGSASDEEIQRVLLWIRLKRDAVLENNVQHAYGLVFDKNMPGYPADLEFLRAVCQYRLGDLEAAEQSLDLCLFAYISQISDTSQIQDRSYVYAAHKYVSARRAGMDTAAIRALLSAVFEEAVVRKVTDDFEDQKTVLAKLYPACNSLQCETCQTVGCRYPDLRALYSKLDKMAFSRNVAKTELHKLFEDYNAET